MEGLRDGISPYSPLDSRFNMCLVKSTLPLTISPARMAEFLKRGGNVTARVVAAQEW